MRGTGTDELKTLLCVILQMLSVTKNKQNTSAVERAAATQL